MQHTLVFNASLAYECLTSVPFNAAVATRFLQYYNDTLQFQSTLAYLKNPPLSYCRNTSFRWVRSRGRIECVTTEQRACYQQPGVDILLGLEHLQQAINAGIFPNQYEFEAALQTLLYATHDSHVALAAGVLAAFAFASPYDIVSVSLDGVQLSKIYFANDLFESSYFTTYTPSAVASINGVDVVTYLTQFASKNSYGTLEPHSDWNQLMLSPALDIQGLFDIFSGRVTFYPGDIITFKFENGTELSDRYRAIYNSVGPTGPLETGGDFYNFFVLGFYPASYDSTQTDNTIDSDLTGNATDSTTSSWPLTWDNPVYPKVPDIAQPGLGIYGGGYISGYFLNSTSISVLSIPSFDEDGDAIGTFQSTIWQFITQSKAAGLQKVVIDLQQNNGGQALLAIDTFKQFFPDIDPFTGSRMRAQRSADVIGETLTDYWDGLTDVNNDYYNLVANEWVATDRINADTGHVFTTWTEFFGPHSFDRDSFTTTQRYNLSDDIFDQASVNDLDANFTVSGYGATPAPPRATPPYAAEDIILLSDGICHSACALFMEMMHHEAGVRVVVAGGRPNTGPMQAPSGTRGARLYPVDELDANIELTQLHLLSQSSPEANFLPNRTEANNVRVISASINLRDQVRRGETVPLQFAYEAADCRIFYTPQTVYNYSALWQYAADAIWSKPSFCVQGSTGFATTATNKTDFVGPSSRKPGTFSVNLTALKTSSIPHLTSLNYGLPDRLRPRQGPEATNCVTDRDCKRGDTCATISTYLSKGHPGHANRCVSKCFIALTPCPNGGKCVGKNSTGTMVGSQTLHQGFCQPVVPTKWCGGAS